MLHVVLLDEAQRLLASGSLDRDDIAFLPTIDTIVRARKYGIGFVAALQQPSMIHRAFISNAGFILAGPLNDDADTRIVRSVFNLTPEQLQYYRTMPTRTFLLHRSGTVLPVIIPEINLPEVLWDKERTDAWNVRVLGRIPALEALIYKEPPYVPPAAIHTQQSDQSLPDSDELTFLKMVNDHPCHKLNDYYEMLKDHFKLQKANDIRKELVKYGLVIPHKITHGGRGSLIGLEITEKGYRNYRLKPHLVFSRGADYAHTFIVENVKRHYETKGAQVRREARIGSHFADLLVEPA
ncbi:MAG: hypothetical protein AAB393_15155, partial [Bacteroidota bacterium]